MSQHKAPTITVCVENATLRDAIVARLQGRGYDVSVADRWGRVYRKPLSDILILETGSDISALMQTVYSLYEVHGLDESLPILALARRQLLEQNKAIGVGWMVKDHAAVTALVPYDDIDPVPTYLLLSIAELCRRMVFG